VEAPPERRRDQCVQRGPKMPVSFVMAVMATKPPDGSGAELLRAGAGGLACQHGSSL